MKIVSDTFWGCSTLSLWITRWIQMFNESEHLWDLSVTLAGTFLGVLLAFVLNGWWERRQARKKYASALHSIRHDLAHLRTICGLVRGQIAKEGEIVIRLEAPILDASLTNSAFQDLASHGIITCLKAVSSVCAAVRNVLASDRPSSPEGLADLQTRIDGLARAIAYVQTVLDEEVRILGHPMYKTPKDTEIIQGLQDALQARDPGQKSEPEKHAR
jgi:hypothetical protein